MECAVNNISEVTRRNLTLQGFARVDDTTLRSYARSLRFTPAVGATLVVVGLALQSPLWLGVVALIALSGALFPRGMVIDVVYNVVVQRAFGVPPLPATPTPRRFSYLISASLLVASSLSFAWGVPLMGWLFGSVVIAGATLLAARLWCLGSWIYSRTCGRAQPEAATR